LLATSRGNELKLLSPQTLLETKTFSGHKGTITSVVFCGDGKHLLTSSTDNSVVYWDYKTGLKKSEINATSSVTGSALMHDSKVAFISQLALKAFDFSSGKEEFNINSSSPYILIATSPDSRIICVVNSVGTIQLYSYEGKLLKEWKLASKDLSALAISPSGKLIVAGFEDGTIATYTPDGTLLANMKDAKKWIRCLKFSTDSKYFAAGDDWGNCLIYSVDKNIIAEKIYLKGVPVLNLAFAPDGTTLTIVAEGEITNWDIKKLQIASVFKLKDQKDRTPPQIFVSNPANIQDEKVRVYKDMIDIRGTLMDDFGIRSLRVNGIDVPLKENNNFVIIQPLSMGDNTFTIEVKDVNDNISVKRFTVTRKNTAGEEYDVSKARNFLFIVGINDYEYWPKLNNAVKDANDITNVLLKKYNFEFDNLTLLKNEQATRSNIYKSLRSLIEQITPQDNLLIYFSGHGYFDPLLNEGYWIPIDARPNNSGDYLSNSDILKLVGNIDSQHTFLIADACFSGSLFSDSKRGLADNVEKFKSRWGLASGRLEVVSDGEIGKNSPFASAALSFLSDNQKDKIAISEWIQFVKMKVAETSEQTPLGNPLKVNGDDGGEMVLHLKKH
jgi:WD40 repeat protein